MNRISLALLATAGALTLAGCVPSQYGYGGYGNPYYGRDDGYTGRDDYYGSDGTFRCESEDHRVRRCNVNTSGGVRLVRQESDAACIQGRTWGYDRDGVWVSGGCRARFAIGGGYGYEDGYPSRDAQTIRCESQDERRRTCRLSYRARSVALTRQLSDTRCQQGYNWGWSSDSLWVDRGCRAEFVARY